jgi:glycosyltransferase involved in cell wall biosynthesis
MKIAIASQFPESALEDEVSGRGGGQLATWLPQLAQSFECADGVDIHWLIACRSAKHISIKKKWGQTFHIHPTVGITAGLLCGRLPQVFEYSTLLKRINPDIVHTWGTETMHGAAFWASRAIKVLSMQGIITEYFKTGDLTDWRWRFFKYWEPKTIRRADVVTCESQWGINKLRVIKPKGVFKRIEYGVNPSFYDVQWSPDPGNPTFLYVGGLNRLKGVDILLEMLKRQPHRPWKMAFAGSGYLENELRSLNDPKVEVLGTLTTPQLQNKLASSWALVHPARADTSPNVVKEARVIGLPVVGSPAGGHAAYIEDNVDGAVITSLDPDVWFEVLNKLSSKYQACLNIGAVNNAKYREIFKPEHTANSFIDLYRNVFNKL